MTASPTRGGAPQSIGDILRKTAQGSNARDRRPRPEGWQEHRSKVHVGTKTLVGEEGNIWRPITRRIRAQLMDAARHMERIGRLGHRARRSRRKAAFLPPVALEVYEALLFHFMDRRSGRCDPALRTIADYLGRSVSAVKEAIDSLREHGFLRWLMRYAPTGRQGWRGPQVEQASNAYEPTMPAGLARPEPPTPDCEAQRKAADAGALEAMLASLPLDQLPGAIITDDGLAAVLARLGRTIMTTERGSAQPHESLKR